MTTIDRSFLRVKREFCNRRDSISKRGEDRGAEKLEKRKDCGMRSRRGIFFVDDDVPISRILRHLYVSTALFCVSFANKKAVVRNCAEKKTKRFLCFFFFSLSPFFFFFFPFSQREEDREEGATNAARFLINFLIFDIWYLIILEWNEIRDSYCG